MTSPATTPTRPSSTISALEDRFATTGQRLRLYGLVGFVLFLAAVALRVMDAHHYHEAIDFAAQDARGYYVYLPAVIVEGDLRFEKEMLAHWGRESKQVPSLLSVRTPLGYVNNQYPIGMALTLSPAFLLAHGITLLVHHVTPSALFLPDGYSLLYELFSCAWVLTLGWGMMALTDRLIVKYFDVRPAAIAAGILLYWFGSNYIWYYTREMFMVHIVSAFWIIASVTLILQIVDKAKAKQRYVGAMALLGITFGMAFICRPTNVFIAPFFAWAFIRICRLGGFKQFARTVPVALTFFIPAGLQMAVWQHMTGRPIFYSYGNQRFYFLQPALWQTLFHVKHGIFLWTPLFILSVIGIVARMRRPNHRIEPAVGCFVLSGLILWYLNSSWWCWWFADSFGGRAWIELAPLFIMGLVFIVNGLWTTTKSKRTAAIAFISFCLMLNGVMLVLYQLRLIPRS